MVKVLCVDYEFEFEVYDGWWLMVVFILMAVWLGYTSWFELGDRGYGIPPLNTSLRRFKIPVSMQDWGYLKLQNADMRNRRAMGTVTQELGIYRTFTLLQIFWPRKLLNIRTKQTEEYSKIWMIPEQFVDIYHKTRPPRRHEELRNKALASSYCIPFFYAQLNSARCCIEVMVVNE